MATLRHLYVHTKKYGISHHKALFTVSLMLLFFKLFDGVLLYVLPILVVNNGFSTAEMGLILGSSSVAGAVFDFILSKFLKKVHFRRLYLLMLALCFIYPLVLWSAKSLFIYLAAMVIWGLYYDLMQFGNYDFISRHTAEDEHASSFGVVEVFKNIGCFIAPLIAAFLVNQVVDFKPFTLSWIFISVSLIFYLITYKLTSHKKLEDHDHPGYRRINVLAEIRLWRKIGWQIMPVLCFTTLFTFFDSFFWTIGPLFAAQLKSIHSLGELIVPMYYLPPLLIGWFVGIPVKKLGKKHTAFICFALGCLILSLTAIFSFQPLVIDLIFFTCSFFTSVAWPSIQGTYADYISETTLAESEIEGLGDFFTNIGCVIGPAAAGILAGFAGNAQAFTILGIIGFFITLFIWHLTPRQINVKVGKV